MQVYNIINERVYHSSQIISAKVKKIVRKSEAQFRRKLRKLRLRQNNDFLIKKQRVLALLPRFYDQLCTAIWLLTHLLLLIILYQY